MKPEAQRIAIAEACPDLVVISRGGVNDYVYMFWKGRTHNVDFDPLSDLNAMHEAEKVLNLEHQQLYPMVLEELVNPDFFNDRTTELTLEMVLFCDIHATAAQRAEAFLRTIGKWEEGAQGSS